MRFKKWRNRPGCEGAFSLFLLNNRGCRGAFPVRPVQRLSSERAYHIKGGLPPGWVGLDDF